MISFYEKQKKLKTMPYFIFSHFTISDQIRNDIDKILKKLPECKKIRYKVCHPKDPNDIFDFYYFKCNIGCGFDNYIRILISSIFKKYHIESHIVDCFESPPFENYLYFNEKMIPDAVKQLLMKYLKMMDEVIEIKRNIYDGKQIATYLIIQKNT